MNFNNIAEQINTVGKDIHAMLQDQLKAIDSSNMPIEQKDQLKSLATGIKESIASQDLNKITETMVNFGKYDKGN